MAYRLRHFLNMVYWDTAMNGWPSQFMVATNYTPSIFAFTPNTRERSVVLFHGAHTEEELYKFAVTLIPHKVKVIEHEHQLLQVTTGRLKMQHRLVFFLDVSGEPPPILKTTSMRYQNLVLVIQVRIGEGAVGREQAAREYGVTVFPSVVFMASNQDSFSHFVPERGPTLRELTKWVDFCLHQVEHSNTALPLKTEL